MLRSCLSGRPLAAASTPQARRGRLAVRPQALQRACRPALTLCSATEQTTAPAADLEEKSESFIDLFERASTPLGTIQRAEAALAATQAIMQALGTTTEAAPKREEAPPRPPPKYAPPAGAAVVPPSFDEFVSLDSVLGDSGSGNGVSGGGGGGSKSSRSSGPTKAEAPRKAAPGPSFWEWSPPEQTPEEASAGPERQLQPKTAVKPMFQVDLPFAFAERDESSLPKFQSDVELPELQSIAEAPSWQDALASLMMAPTMPEQTAEGVEAAAAPAVDIGSMAERLRFAAEQTGVSNGVTADGARWWLESGEEEQENGRLCRYWTFRGVSADGGTEWEEKTWETSDAFNFKQIGAEKSGRDSLGRVWREAWTETHDMDALGLRHIVRSADKWSKGADASQWHEKWNENYSADGKTERDAYKWGCLPPDVIPEDGHAARWCETWGEKWDGRGFAGKWADKWGERDQREGGGQYRRWGDKWSQEFREGIGHRWGETWNDDPDGRGWYSRNWGEDHTGNRQVRKWGHATDGENWDTVQEEDTWYEGVPNFSWRDAFRHSPQLLQVKARLPSSGAGEPGEGEGAGKKNMLRPLSLRSKKPKKP